MITHKRTWLLAGLLWLALWPNVAGGQSSEPIEAYYRSEDLYGQGRYEAALPLAKKALRLGEREFGPGHTTTTTFLGNLAALYLARGAYTQVEPLYRGGSCGSTSRRSGPGTRTWPGAWRLTPPCYGQPGAVPRRQRPRPAPG